MREARRFFIISSAVSFALGVFFFAYFNYLEYSARQALPPEMRTSEAIRNVYDGAVCPSCEMAGTGLLFLFFAIGTLIAFFWGIYGVFSKKQATLK
jgi:hypothetical protein